MEYLESKYSNILETFTSNLNPRDIDLGLERMIKALDILGNPSSSIPAIHIAGTNGKGSIAKLIQSSLICSKIKVGITTSPHLIDWRERICTDDNLISKNDFIRIVEDILSKTKAIKLTTFELIILTALKYFELSEVEVIILETGLGGRLDATTAHPLRPIIALGGIGLDHCEYLGNTLEKITKEKAEVISPGTLVISANQEPEVRKILKETIQRKSARMEWAKALDENWSIGIPGEIQKENAAVAKIALEALSNFGFEIKLEDIKRGFSLANWPGRLQTVFWEGRPVLIDGAHNIHAAKQLSKERTNWENHEKGIDWILAIQKQKNAALIIKELIKPNDKVWIVKVPNHESWSCKEILKLYPRFSEQIIEGNEVEDILRSIKSGQGWLRSKPVITGSLYLIGYLMKQRIISERINL